MTYVLAGLVVLAVVYWGGRGRRWPLHPDWRAASAIAGIVIFITAAFIGVRGGWSKAIELAIVSVALTAVARWPRPRPGSVAAEAGAMSVSQARDILGVDATASREEIQAAYTRLMRRVHPDHGGASGLAVQLNLARDRLLRR